MYNEKLVKYQALLWIAGHVQKDKMASGCRQSFIGALERTISYKDPQKEAATQIIDDLIASGAIEPDENSMSLGPNYDAVLEQYLPIRKPITADMLTPWVGEMFFARVEHLEDLGASPWTEAAIIELLCRQREGRLAKILKLPAKRIKAVDRWNEFVETGLLDRVFVTTLEAGITSYAGKFELFALKEEQLPSMAEHLNKGLREGFSTARSDLGVGIQGESYDFFTGEKIILNLANWQLNLVTLRKKDGYKPKPLDMDETFPAIVHIVFETDGALAIVDSRDSGEKIVGAIDDAHGDDIDTPLHFNSHEGALQFSIDTFQGTGVMDLDFSASLSNIVIDHERGSIHLQTKEPAQNDRCEVIGDRRFERLTIGTWSSYIQLISSKAGITPDEAKNLLTEEENSSNAGVFCARGVASTSHLYIPHGRNTSAFNKAMSQAGWTGDQEQGCLLAITKDPIVFDEEIAVLDLKLNTSSSIGAQDQQ